MNCRACGKELAELPAGSSRSDITSYMGLGGKAAVNTCGMCGGTFCSTCMTRWHNEQGTSMGALKSRFCSEACYRRATGSKRRGRLP